MSEAWQQAHDNLKTLLQKEISMMREILGNMRQEEISLQYRDKDKWNQTLQERSAMLQLLSSIRKARLDASQKLEDLTLSEHHLSVAEDIESCELLSMRDQLMALLEKTNFQNNQNQSLFKRVERQLELPLGLPPRLPEPDPKRAKKKATVATYPRND